MRRILKVPAVTVTMLSMLAASAGPVIAAPADPAADPSYAQQSEPSSVAGSLDGIALEPVDPAEDVEIVKDAEQGGRLAEETDRLIVTFADTSDTAQASSLASAAEASPIEGPEVVRERVDATTIVEIAEPLEGDELEEAVEQLEADPNVAEVEPDWVVVNGAAAYPRTPNDPHFASRQWNLRYIAAPDAWQQSTGDGVTIGVGDTGTTSHPDLNGKWVSTYDFLSDAWHSKDPEGRDANAHDEGDDVLGYGHAWHGTHVAGIAGAATNNGRGVAGVAPEAKVSMARNMGRGGRGYVSDYADSLMWLAGIGIPGVPANRTPAQVVNFSEAFDATACPSVLQRAIDRNAQRGVPTVVAAGNAAKSANGVAPANCSGAIVVGATNSSQRMASFSNWGPMLDVVAPGQDIYSTTNTGVNSLGGPTYGYLSGTSMAAPTVAGVVGLMKEKNPGLSVEQVRTILRSSGQSVGGYPFVNARKALAATPDRRGAIGRYFLDRGGSDVLGVAVAPERPTGHSAGAVREHYRFDNGRTYFIYSSPRTGTHHVDGGSNIGGYFLRSGGNARFGFPVGDLTFEGGTWHQDFVHPDKGTSTRLSFRSGAVTAQQSPFIEVMPGRQHFEAILWMHDNGYANGWADHTFRPSDPVHRDAMIAFLYRMAGSPAVKLPATSPFEDVPASHPFYREIVWAHQNGIATGWSDGTFRPNESIDRNAMAAFLYRLADEPAVSTAGASPFRDVSKGDAFYKEIVWMKNSGISTGWSDGTFRPFDDTNRDATAAFLQRYDARF